MLYFKSEKMFNTDYLNNKLSCLKWFINLRYNISADHIAWVIEILWGVNNDASTFKRLVSHIYF